MIIIFAGAIGRCCGMGGKAWAYMQYLAGLRALGYDIFYLEDCGEESWVYNWDTEQLTTDMGYPVEYVRDCIEPIGFKSKWIYRAGDREEGMPLDDFIQICSEASLMIVLADPITLWRHEYNLPLRRIFIDVDPGFTQFKLVNGDTDLVNTVNKCERLFTIGKNIGNVDCPIPNVGRQWFKMVPPVSLPDWPTANTGPKNHFSSVMDWRGFSDVVYHGVLYGQKDKEFQKFFELPRLTSQPFVVALQGANPEKLTGYGWKVVPGDKLTWTPWSYQSYIQDSRAEFGIAKHGYVLSSGGWFSDRSVCYLASGKPVLIQDTGQSDWLPIGEGVLVFTDVSEALQGIEAINADYEHHCRAARKLAEKYFSAEVVFPPLIEAAMA